MNKKSEKLFMHEIFRICVMMLFDVCAMVVAYYIAFAIRFFVRYGFETGLDIYLNRFFESVPIYGVLVIVLFWIFNLYNAVWEYAGIRDFNRIIKACVIVAVIFTVVTLLFGRRLPITVYALGAILQLLFVLVSRFAYKIYLMERNQNVLIKKDARNIVIVGCGDNSQLAYRKYEAKDNIIAFFDYTFNKRKRYINGIPIFANIDRLEDFIKEKEVKKFIFTDSISSEEQVKSLEDICDKYDIPIQTFEIKKTNNKVYLASPTMHGEELEYMRLAYDTNWMSTVGENINTVEKSMAKYVGMKHAVALSSGTAALHLAVRLAGYKLYGEPKLGDGIIKGKTVFCSDLTFAASSNPIVYEGGLPVFVDSELDTWNMDPLALEKAFELYPDTKIVICVHLYGMPAKIERIREIVHNHGALLIEDAAESFGATVGNAQTGSFGDISVISFNGNKIITGSSGGCLLVNDENDAKLVRKWSTQSREDVPWYEHTQLGYNYRMSNVIAGVIRGQIPYLRKHREDKYKLYKHYEKNLNNDLICMNPIEYNGMKSNCWLSCILIKDKFVKPIELISKLKEKNYESRPIWKPMHMQPIFADCPFVTVNMMKDGFEYNSVSEYLFDNGICLPSDIKMTDEQQKIIEQVIVDTFN